MILSKIRALFIPEKMGDYYLVAQRILSVEINPTSIRAALIKAQGYKRTIEKTIEKNLNTHQKSSPQEIIDALKSIKTEVEKYDQLYALVPSNLCVLKELTLPAATADKIKLLVPFEIEATLPFALSEATLASTIMGTVGSERVAVLACAIKNSVLADYLSLYYQADMTPTRVSVDILELYTLYSSIEELELPANDVLVYLDKDVTRLGVVHDGYLSSARVINSGLAQLASLLDASAHPQDFETTLKQSTSTEEQALFKFFSNITFTLQAARSKKSHTGQEALTSTLVGPGAEYPLVKKLIEETTGVPCRSLALDYLLTKKFKHKIIVKNSSTQHISDKYILPISAALALPLSRNFDLHTTYSEGEEESALTRQLITLGLLTLLTLSIVIGLGWWRARKLNQEINTSENEAINRLKKEFPTISARSSKSLDAVKNAASTELAKEKSIWFALSPQKRASFLRYLQGLSTQLNTQELGLTLSQLIFDEDSITLEGEVRDYEGLKRFEQALRRSKLFSAVPRLEQLKFSTKIPLDKATGEPL